MDNSSFIPADGSLSGPDSASSQWTDIIQLYVSRNGATRLHTAERDGKRFVLKSLKEDLAQDPAYRTALRDEFETGMRLDHPNIRRTIGFETIPGIGEAIILEYIDGEPLSRALPANRVTGGNIRTICAQLCSALRYLHSKQLYYPDLQPANVMMSFSGEVVKLIDFPSEGTGSYALLRDPDALDIYLAPEQHSPGARPTIEADVYSLGKLMKEMGGAVGDHELARVAKRSCRREPSQRPHSIAETGLLALAPRTYSVSSSRFPSSSPTSFPVVLLWLLALLIAALLIPVIFHP